MDESYVLPPPATPPRRPPERSQQPVGAHFTTPQKRRPPRKDSAIVNRPGVALRQQRLKEELHALMETDEQSSNQSVPTSVDADIEMPDVEDTHDDGAEDLDPPAVDKSLPQDDSLPRRLLPDTATEKLYSTWLALVPTLVPAYLGYLQASQARIGQLPALRQWTCHSKVCLKKDYTILCLHSHYLESNIFQGCGCISVAQVLVKNGLFPTSPTSPRVAVSIDLLDFYFALFERSADAVSALASALKSIYQRRGFPILNEKGEPIQDPFRRGIGHAVQWYDCLRNRPEAMVESAIDECLRYIMSHPSSSEPAEGAASDAGSFLRRQQQEDTHGGGNDGGDIHVALDATFSQRHNISAGESPWFYEPKFFLSKEEVDAVGIRITAARKKPAHKHDSQVPEAALDQCEKSYQAADEKKEKTHGTKFDDTGLMALVCRHDIVLFLANVDTPGEQQKYGIALLERLFQHVPAEATVAAFYDIGCVLDRSIHAYDLLPETIVSRLIFATSVMHAYGHQWACQLVYNPRLREGLGLSEGEGTERVWSKFRKLIGVTRSSARSRRIWLLDRHAEAINIGARNELGNWIRSRLRHGVEGKTLAANTELGELGVSVGELRIQWEAQRKAQLSLRQHAPARLKKELDAVLNLQVELDAVEVSLGRLQTMVGTDEDHPIVHDYIASLKRTHTRTIQKVESLYSSLNVPQDFPELQGLPLEFVRILLMARDLKINIRKRAIGSFFEWDKLNRAAGGRDQPLGTKLHQQTQKAISKRTPALITAIRKFNKYCDELEALYEDDWGFPLPQALPTELGALRDEPDLLADVWISPVASNTPKWLEDSATRQGIRAMLTLDRCREERRRLGNEADNLCRWYGRELSGVELALRSPNFAEISFLLRQRKEELLLLQMLWRTPLVSALRFQFHTEEAVRIARHLSGSGDPRPIRWVHVPSFEEQMEATDGLYDPDSSAADEETVLAHDALDELFAYDDPDPADSAAVTPSPRGSAATVSEAVMLKRTLVLSDDSPEDMLVAVENPLPEASSPLVSQHTDRTLPATPHAIRFIIPAKDLQRLQRPCAQLSDDCINTGAQVLLRHIGTGSILGGDLAILSTRVMSMHRAEADDNSIWRDCYNTEFWRKNVWIIPIHHLVPSPHWTVAIVYMKEQQIAYFDSFASQDRWESDAAAVFQLVYKLHRLAEDYKHGPFQLDGDWVSYPLLKEPVQKNGYDCGVWVLACIAAILRGFHVVFLTSEQITEFRMRLFALVLTLTEPVNPVH
ncbi:hypothetical protein TRAPUB_10739 [Trametes pubescens]|uniref:Ubiquitin-like protease family profile domain-containing protein n=1 Tax=Trametes pubescens TaxID=154538 RepID=A0A1M2VYM8_TRAPU|nr:hypothetical protein TRAPUB_10739 [Trametes pubescens]